LELDWFKFWFSFETNVLYQSVPYEIGVSSLKPAKIRVNPEKHIHKKKKVYFGISGFPIIASDEIQSLFELYSPLEVDRDGKVPNIKTPGDIVI
jgi:hypothetical protein